MRHAVLCGKALVATASNAAIHTLALHYMLSGTTSPLDSYELYEKGSMSMLNAVPSKDGAS